MITSAALHAIVAAFELSGGGESTELVGPVARGEVGQIWRLDTATGSFAVKEPFDSSDEDWCDDRPESASFQEAAAVAGVRSPGVVRTPDGAVVARIEGSPVRLYEWVELNDPDPGLDPASVGAMLGRLHTCGFEGQQPTHWWYRTSVGAARWDEATAEMAAVGAPFADDLAAMRDELVAMEELLEDPTALQTCHRDVWADNVRTTADGSVCVIDWESSGLADPSGELAMMLLEFAYDDAARARTLVSAYREAGGPGRVDHRGSFTMVIAQFGHLIDKICRQWVASEPLDPQRQRCIENFAEFVDKPHSRTLFDQILDHVAAQDL